MFIGHVWTTTYWTTRGPTAAVRSKKFPLRLLLVDRDDGTISLFDDEFLVCGDCGNGLRWCYLSCSFATEDMLRVEVLPFSMLQSIHVFFVSLPRYNMCPKLVPAMMQTMLRVLAKQVETHSTVGWMLERLLGKKLGKDMTVSLK